jgi:hypothetical protein
MLERWEYVNWWGPGIPFFEACLHVGQTVCIEIYDAVAIMMGDYRGLDEEPDATIASCGLPRTLRAKLVEVSAYLAWKNANSGGEIGG